MKIQQCFKAVAIVVATAAVAGLSGCGALVAPKEGVSRHITEQPPSKAVAEPRTDNASALRLAHLLIEQGRLEAALGVYGELDKKQALKPRELLEYANVAALVHPPKSTYGLFSRLKALSDDKASGFSAKEVSALLTGLGRAEIAVSQREKAQADLFQAVELNAENAVAWNALGVLHDAEGRHDLAQAAFKKALAASPADARLLNNLGLSHLAAGEAGEAVKRLTEAAAFDGDSETVKLNLALAQFMRGAPGDRARAKSGLESFLSPVQTKEFLSTFGEIRSRIRAKESTMAEELVRAADKMYTLRPKSGEAAAPLDNPVIEVRPEDFRPVKASTAKSYPIPAKAQP